MITEEIRTEFEQALLEEDLSILEDMEALLANVEEGGGKVAREMDELLVRKLIIKIKLLKEEQERLKRLRDAVKAEWDKKIQKVEQEIEQINGLVKHYLTHANKGKKLQLDVATVSLRPVKHSIKVVNKAALKEYLQQIGKMHQYLKEPEIDTTKVQNDAIAEMETRIQQAVELAKLSNPKITKEELDQVIEEAKAQYLSELPPFMEYKPEDKTISIRMNY
jgi:phage host-nuclease inhibitor protein Gam